MLRPDDVYLVLRGLPTMPLRIRHVERVTNEIAQWMQTRPEVKQVLHPACPAAPATTSGSATSPVPLACFRSCCMTSMAPTLRPRFIEALEFFGIGAS